CEMVAGLRSADLLLADLTLVAEGGEEVVGYVSVSTMIVEPERGDPFDVLNLTPLAVRPDRQGRGIGGALVEAVIEKARKRTEPLLFVEGWAEPESLYPRYFDPRTPNIKVPPEAFEDEAFQMLRLPTYDETKHFGQAIYPDPIRALSHE
ncbi:MAG: GNAT family N-acetyltransferase, partial [Actinomycetota bacterium]